MHLVLCLVFFDLYQLKFIILIFFSLDVKACRGIQHVRQVSFDQFFQDLVSSFCQDICVFVVLNLNNFDCLQIVIKLLLDFFLVDLVVSSILTFLVNLDLPQFGPHDFYDFRHELQVLFDLLQFQDMTVFPLD